jgi:radical SAM protein with 4Fe4S-binding SPASM domain
MMWECRSFHLELAPLCNHHGSQYDPSSPERNYDGPEGGCRPLLSSEGWEQILDKLRPYAQSLKLTGGEPTLHPQFASIVRNVSDLGAPFTLCTNGRWREPERLCALLQSLPYFEGLVISLHGPTPTSHEAFTGIPGSFAQTVSAIKTAVATGLRVSLSCVITHYNWHLIRDMLMLSLKLGTDKIVFNRQMGPTIAGLTASHAEMLAAMLPVRSWRWSGEPATLGDCLPQCFASTGQAGCLAGIDFVHIDPWGQVRPCGHAPSLCGNILTQSVDEMWHSADLDCWRQFLPPECNDCSTLAICQGGCRALALGSEKGTDPLIARPLAPSHAQKARERTYHESGLHLTRLFRHRTRGNAVLTPGNCL